MNTDNCRWKLWFLLNFWYILLASINIVTHGYRINYSTIFLSFSHSIIKIFFVQLINVEKPKNTFLNRSVVQNFVQTFTIRKFLAWVKTDLPHTVKANMNRCLQELIPFTCVSFPLFLIPNQSRVCVYSPVFPFVFVQWFATLQRCHVLVCVPVFPHSSSRLQLLVFFIYFAASCSFLYSHILDFWSATIKARFLFPQPLVFCIWVLHAVSRQSDSYRTWAEDTPAHFISSFIIFMV